jgi:DNA-directed RNA polymerase subunit N (RpoN/RPB10)
MLIPIICFTCGLPLSDKEDMYIELKTKQEKEFGENVDYRTILESLDIKNDCCKMHFITSMVFTDYY